MIGMGVLTRNSLSPFSVNWSCHSSQKFLVYIVGMERDFLGELFRYTSILPQIIFPTGRGGWPERCVLKEYPRWYEKFPNPLLNHCWIGTYNSIYRDAVYMLLLRSTSIEQTKCSPQISGKRILFFIYILMYMCVQKTLKAVDRNLLWATQAMTRLY